MKNLNCLFLRNFTMEPIEDSIINWSKSFDINLKPFFSDYDNIIQSSLNKNFIKKKNINIIVVFLWLPNFSDILANKLPSANEKKINEEIKRHKDFVQIVSNNLKKLKIPIIWVSSILPNQSIYGLFDYKFKFGHENILAKINGDLKRIISNFTNFYFFDLSKFEKNIGTKNFYDERLWYSVKSPFSYNGFEEISKGLSEIFFTINNKRSKCLVLDCDNVLWGGIVGENGVNKIKIRNSNGDSEYSDFQKEILNLHKSGVILAICSKNNIEDVEEVFEKREDMLLKLSDFTIVKANWNNKADNIIQISKELNIGLDSIVFVDDSKFEINLVNKFLPEVKTIHLEKEKSEQNRYKLTSSKYFLTSNLTKEDKLRNKMYKEEVKRTELKKKIVSIDEYLKSLDLQAIVRTPKIKDLERVEQMTQRTNQFNLTTKRYDSQGVQQLLKNKKNYIYILEAKDKFGSYGTCGLVILNIKNDNALIDVFLMSCRVIGRGIENLFLFETLKQISKKEKSIKNFIGEFISTKKNDQVKNFYANNGFKEQSSKNNSKKYLIQVKDLKKIEKKNYIILKKKFS